MSIRFNWWFMSNCQPNARLTVGRSPSRQLAVSWPAAGRRRGARTVRQDRANTSAQTGDFYLWLCVWAGQVSEEEGEALSVLRDSASGALFIYTRCYKERARLSSCGGGTREKLPAADRRGGWGEPGEERSRRSRLMGRNTWLGCKHEPSISNQEVTALD